MGHDVEDAVGASRPFAARFDYRDAAPGIYPAMDNVDRYIESCGLETSLVRLVQLHASQINGCAYCVDMHWKQLKDIGEKDQRLYSLMIWRECPYYTDRERAALMWTEAITRVANLGVPDNVYRQASSLFGERELADLTLAVVAINGWNRLSIAARLEPGSS